MAIMETKESQACLESRYIYKIVFFSLFYQYYILVM